LVDTDLLAREVVEPGQPALLAIREAFGPEVMDSGGCLLRQALADRVFVDAAARQRLEAIVHPRIQEAWRARVACWQDEGRELGVVVIPLLYEKGLERHFDTTVCVGCGRATQWGRLVGRGWTPEEIQRRLGAQWTVAEKMRRADRVIWNEGSLKVLAEQSARVLRGFRPRTEQ